MVGPLLARAQASWQKSQGEGELTKRSKERSCSCWKGAEPVEAVLSPYPPSGPEAPAKLLQPQAAMEISTSSPANHYPILLLTTESRIIISHPAASPIARHAHSRQEPRVRDSPFWAVAKEGEWALTFRLTRSAGVTPSSTPLPLPTPSSGPEEDISRTKHLKAHTGSFSLAPPGPGP